MTNRSIVRTITATAASAVIGATLLVSAAPANASAVTPSTLGCKYVIASTLNLYDSSFSSQVDAYLVNGDIFEAQSSANGRYGGYVLYAKDSGLEGVGGWISTDGRWTDPC